MIKAIVGSVSNYLSFKWKNTNVSYECIYNCKTIILYEVITYIDLFIMFSSITLGKMYKNRGTVFFITATHLVISLKSFPFEKETITKHKHLRYRKQLTNLYFKYTTFTIIYTHFLVLPLVSVHAFMQSLHTGWWDMSKCSSGPFP